MKKIESDGTKIIKATSVPLTNIPFAVGDWGIFSSFMIFYLKFDNKNQRYFIFGKEEILVIGKL